MAKTLDTRTRIVRARILFGNVDSDALPDAAHAFAMAMSEWVSMADSDEMEYHSILLSTGLRLLSL